MSGVSVCMSVHGAMTHFLCICHLAIKLYIVLYWNGPWGKNWRGDSTQLWLWHPLPGETLLSIMHFSQTKLDEIFTLTIHDSDYPCYNWTLPTLSLVTLVTTELFLHWVWLPLLQMNFSYTEVCSYSIKKEKWIQRKSTGGREGNCKATSKA